jgi:hypothetical protein
VRHAKYHPVPWKEHRSRFHYDYDADELTPDTHRTYMAVTSESVVPVPIYGAVPTKQTRC